MFSFFDLSTRMAMPFAAAGWKCYCIDIQHPPGLTQHSKHPNIIKVGKDVSELLLKDGVKADFAAFFPPCTHVAASGCAWYKKKGLRKLIEALDLFAKSIELAEQLGCPYFIENPVGTVSTYYRKPDHYFDPCDYAGYLKKPEWQDEERYTKKTCLWIGGGFVMPEPKRLEPVHGSKMHKLPDTKRRPYLRSLTPRGFSKAVALYNGL